MQKPVPFLSPLLSPPLSQCRRRSHGRRRGLLFRRLPLSPPSTLRHGSDSDPICHNVGQLTPSRRLRTLSAAAAPVDGPGGGPCLFVMAAPPVPTTSSGAAGLGWRHIPAASHGDYPSRSAFRRVCFLGFQVSCSLVFRSWSGVAARWARTLALIPVLLHSPFRPTGTGSRDVAGTAIPQALCKCVALCCLVTIDIDFSCCVCVQKKLGNGDLISTA